MSATVESAFVLIDRASGTITKLRAELRGLQSDAQKAGRDMDSLSGPRIQQQMEAEAKATRSAGDSTKAYAKEADKASDSSRKLETRLKGVESQAKRTSKETDKLHKSVSQFLKWGAITTAVGGVVNVVGALGGGVIELLPRIGDLAGAGAGLASAYVGAGAAMGVVKLATSGLSQALQGNKKALAGLTPEARGFVQELKAMNPELQRLRSSAQGGLFGGASNLLDVLRKQAPGINAIVSQTSKSLGGLLDFGAGQIKGPAFMRDLGTVVGEGNTAFGDAGKSAIYLAEALEQVLIAAKPLVDWMGRMAVQESHALLIHARMARATGELGHYFDRTKTSIQLFAQVGGRVLGGLRGVFHAASGDGDALWKSIDRAAGRFDAWSNSVSGQRTMEKYFRAIRPELQALGTSLGRIIRLFADLSGGTGGMTMTIRALGDAAGAADKLVRALGPVGQMLGGIVTAGYALDKLGVGKIISKLGGIGGITKPGGRKSTVAEELTGGGIYGMRGITAKAGSLANPIATLIVDKGGAPVPMGGGGGAAGAAETAATEERSAGGVILPKGVSAAETAATDAEKVGAGAGTVGLLSRVKGAVPKLGGLGTGLLRGAGIAGTGVMVSQIGSQALAPVIGGKASSMLGKVGTGASIGAGVGSAVPIVGTALGAGVGALGGSVAALFGKGGPLAGAPETAAQEQKNNPAEYARFGPVGTSDTPYKTAQSSATSARNEMAKFDQQINAVNGDLNRLSPRQLEQLQREAQRLAANPALKGYAAGLQDIGQEAQAALMKKAVPAFKAMAAEAGRSLSDIQLQAKINAATLPQTLGKGSQAARAAVAQSFALAADDVRKSMNAGVVSTKQGMAAINRYLSQELKALGVNISPQLAGVIGSSGVQALAKRAQTGGTGGSSDRGKSTSGSSYGATAATGARLPGPAIGDHIPLLSRSGGLLGVADGGELVVNQHTERDVDSILGLFGTRLSSMVANETRPHARKFATGGRVVLDSGVNMSVGQEPSILSDLRALSSELRKTVYVISGYRSPAHSVSVGGFSDDPHTRGQAADIGVGSPTLNSMFGVKESQLRAVGLYRPFYPPSAAEANHVQLVAGGAKGKIGALSVGMPKAIKAPKVHGGGVVGQAAQGVLNTAAKAATSYVQSKASAGGLDFSGVSGLGGSAGANEKLGRAMMLAAGWGAGQWPSLQALWTQESGWNANAVNPSSGAYGIPQALGHGHPYNLGDARAQIAWGLNYIKGRYGSPAAAEAHERANNWYALGGRLPRWGGWHAGGMNATVSRPTIFGAGERGPERVTVTPQRHNTTSGKGTTVNIAKGAVQIAGGVSDKKVQAYVEKRLQQFAEEVAAEIAAGAEEDEGQVIANGR